MSRESYDYRIIKLKETFDLNEQFDDFVHVLWYLGIFTIITGILACIYIYHHDSLHVRGIIVLVVFYEIVIFLVIIAVQAVLGILFLILADKLDFDKFFGFRGMAFISSACFSVLWFFINNTLGLFLFATTILGLIILEVTVYVKGMIKLRLRFRVVHAIKRIPKEFVDDRKGAGIVEGAIYNYVCLKDVFKDIQLPKGTIAKSEILSDAERALMYLILRVPLVSNWQDMAAGKSSEAYGSAEKAIGRLEAIAKDLNDTVGAIIACAAEAEFGGGNVLREHAIHLREMAESLSEIA